MNEWIETKGQSKVESKALSVTRKKLNYIFEFIKYLSF